MTAAEGQQIQRLPAEYFDQLYANSPDPWDLAGSWYERRRHAIMLALLPSREYRHAFEPGCSVGVLTEQLTYRCHRVTATDVALAALERADRRLRAGGRSEQVALLRQSVEEPWPDETLDLVVLSELCYYLPADTLRAVLDREIPRLPRGATVVASHWRRPVPDYPLTGERAQDVIAATPGLHVIGSYRDADVAIEVFDTAGAPPVSTRQA